MDSEIAKTPQGRLGEMEEIAATFNALGLTGQTFEGAADIYCLVQETSLGKETPEECDRSRPLADIVATLSNESSGHHS